MRRLVMALVLGALAGCASPDYRPLTYTNIDDMRPGPGLFTGRDGEFVVFRKDNTQEP